jgi:acyl-CoA reductase-like NAD-dependent aldehyde dehydrogenase
VAQAMWINGDVERAVAAAGVAFQAWRWVPAVERADLLHEIARLD